MKIGFDLDGILLPDWSQEEPLKEYLKARVTFFEPLFKIDKKKCFYNYW